MKTKIKQAAADIWYIWRDENVKLNDVWNIIYLAIRKYNNIDIPCFNFCFNNQPSQNQ